MSPKIHASADLAVVSFLTLLAAPAAVAIFPLSCVVLRLALGGYTAGAWAWMTLPFAVTGAAIATTLISPPAPAFLGLVCLASGAALAIIQYGTRADAPTWLRTLEGSPPQQRV
ncbi:MAG: hypothetical protein ACJ762_00545 [Solirubrobacteraceae bacterium]